MNFFVRKENEDYQSFVTLFRESNNKKGEMDNYMSPVQRGPRYALLLQELAKVDASYSEALSAVQKSMRNINAQKAESDYLKALCSPEVNEVERAKRVTFTGGKPFFKVSELETKVFSETLEDKLNPRANTRFPHPCRPAQQYALFLLSPR